MDGVVTRLINQVLVMFMLMAVGFLLFKIHMITKPATQSMMNVAIYAATPCTMVLSFVSRDFSMELVINALWSCALGLVTTLIGILLCKTIFRSADNITKYGIIFNNVGFIGIPIVQSVLGVEYVFYMSMFVAVGTLTLWTYGVVLVSGDKSEASFKKIITNPSVIATFIGIILFVTGIKLPFVLDKTMNNLGNLNAPLAMLILGCYLAEANIPKTLKTMNTWKIVVGRMLLVPLLMIPILMVLPSSVDDIKVVALIAAATPVGSMIAILAQKYGGDYAYGAGVVGITTIISMATLPLMLTIWSMVA